MSRGRVGHCNKCGFQWVLLDGIKVRRSGRDAEDAPVTTCPFCESDKIRIEYEANADDDD